MQCVTLLRLHSGILIYFSDFMMEGDYFVIEKSSKKKVGPILDDHVSKSLSIYLTFQLEVAHSAFYPIAKHNIYHFRKDLIL